MRLQRTRTRSVKGKDYHKWVLNPPGEIIASLGWKEGMELDATVEDGTLVVRLASPKD